MVEQIKAKRQIGKWLGLAATGLAADQFSKTLVTAWFTKGTSFAVTDFFNLVYVVNHGAAFSLFAEQGGWQRWVFTAIAVVASFALATLIVRNPFRVDAGAYTLILSGALGNLADRVTRGTVIDWLDFHLQRLHWPAFNLADVFIFIGVLMLFVASFRRR